MAILNGGSAASGIGAALGSGLGSGLQNLVQQKMSEMSQQKQHSKLTQALLGIPEFGLKPDQATQLAGLPESTLNTVLKNLQQGNYEQGLAQQWSNLINPEQNLPNQSSEPNISNQQVTNNPTDEPNISNQQVTNNPTEQVSKPRLKGKDFIEQIKFQSQNKIAKDKLDILKEKEIARREEFDKNLNQREQHFTKKEEALKEKLSAKESREEQQRIDIETKPFYDEIVKASRSGKDSDMRLDRMEKILDVGTGTSAPFHNLLKAVSNGIFRFGIDLHFLEGTNAEEFSKLSNDFVRNAKDIFPGKITNDDLKVFFKIIPSLSHSNEGNRAIIRNMRIFNEAAKVKKQASDQIIKANGYRRPYDYDNQIEEIAGPELDRLAFQFKNGLSKLSTATTPASTPKPILQQGLIGQQLQGFGS